MARSNSAVHCGLWTTLIAVYIFFIFFILVVADFREFFFFQQNGAFPRGCSLLARPWVCSRVSLCWLILRWVVSRVYMCMCKNVCIYVYISVCLCTYTCTCLYIYIYICIYIYMYIYIHTPLWIMSNIEGLSPPRCPFGTGTTVVQNISTRTWWSGGNEKSN